MRHIAKWHPQSFEWTTHENPSQAKINSWTRQGCVLREVDWNKGDFSEPTEKELSEAVTSREA